MFNLNGYVYRWVIWTGTFLLVSGCYDENHSDQPLWNYIGVDTETGTGTENDSVPVVQEPQRPGGLQLCQTNKTCASLANPDDCIANFEDGTGQARIVGPYKPIGFYAYNDRTEGSWMIPPIDHENPSMVEHVKSCDPNNDFVLHVRGGGFKDWGAGVGMDWGGPENVACTVLGALDCRKLGQEKPNFTMEEALADPRCDTPEKIECLKQTAIRRLVRNLSEYVGIGFWILSTSENKTSSLQVAMPIPDTMRFMGACDDDDYDDECSNHFATTISFLPNDAGKWLYKEVLFEELEWSPHWGLQLDYLGYEYFPKTLSIGLQFHIEGYSGGQIFDFYLDDIRLIRKRTL